MSNTLRPYVAAVRTSLTAALTLTAFASQRVERHAFPEIEVPSCPESRLQPLHIARNEHERVCIEPSANATRLSIRIKQADDVERILSHMLTRFMEQRAEAFVVLRRKPMPGYHMSLLITHTHITQLYAHKLVDFVIELLCEVDKEVSDMKLALNGRARGVAEAWMAQLSV